MPGPNQLYDWQSLEARLRYSKPQTEPLSPAFKHQLRATLLAQKEPSNQITVPRFKPVAVVAAVAALLFLVIAVTPAGQIIAETFLRFGPFTLTEAPSAAERTLTATPSAVQPVRTKMVALTEATEQADFTVLYPRYLPVEYRPPAPPMVELVYNRQGHVSSLEMMWFSQNEQQILYYTQSPYTPDPTRSPFELGIGDAEAAPVMVGDSPGVWLQDFSWGIEANNRPVPYNVLIWQLTWPTGETFLFWLGSEAQLPLEEMVQIAESMAPAEAGPANELNIIFGDAITLLGFDLTEEEIKLFWQANAVMGTDLVAFVHWRDAAGITMAQVDRPYATRRWLPGQTMIESYRLSQPNLLPGRYSLVVGLYRPDTGQRLSVPGQPKAEVKLTDIEIKE